MGFLHQEKIKAKSVAKWEMGWEQLAGREEEAEPVPCRFILST